MRTDLENDLVTIIDGDWATDHFSDPVYGDTVAIIINPAREVPEMVDALGLVSASRELVGNFLVSINSDGVVAFAKHHTINGAWRRYNALHDEWLNTNRFDF